MKKQKEERLLTETELELMTLLWKRGEGSVADVIADLPAGRELAYTSVSTILRILEQKEVLKTRKEGRGHVYIPAITKDEYESRTVHHMVERVFDGTPMALARQLLHSTQLSKDELSELKKMIAQLEKRP
jgi:predicted transcriptional regulator